MYSCAYCEYSTSYLQNLKRHEKNKHDKSKHGPSQTGSCAEQSIQPHSQNEMHSNQQEENKDQSHENIEQYQRLYNRKKKLQHMMMGDPLMFPFNYLINTARD